VSGSPHTLFPDWATNPLRFELLELGFLDRLFPAKCKNHLIAGNIMKLLSNQ
jgi:hypothetical protein